jgi:hypothetical protein
MMLRLALFFFLTLTNLLTLSFAEAASTKKGESFSVYIENDSRNIGGPGSDQSYSNGFRFAYTYAENAVPQWKPFLTDWSKTLQKTLPIDSTSFGISLSQQIYTPNDTQTKTPILDDRPYAAWLYLGFTATVQSEAHTHTVELNVGMVGPAALGRQVQNNFHDLIDVPRAEGWNNQLNNEPALQIAYQQRLRFIELKSAGTTYADLIPYFGGSLGNVMIAAHGGAIARLGYNLPNDFGPTRPSSADGDPVKDPQAPEPQEKWGAYGFGGARGNAIARNIFLDGNTFQGSPSVTRYPFTGETEFGFGAYYKNWSANWRFVTKSPEFEEKSRWNSFASISIIYSKDLD